MKTTVEIADSLLAAARRLAAKEGTSVRALIEEGLRKVVDKRSGRGTRASARDVRRRRAFSRLGRRRLGGDSRSPYEDRGGDDRRRHQPAGTPTARTLLGTSRPRPSLRSWPKAPPWAIPAACLHEFLAIAHPRIYRPPTPLARPRQLEARRESPSLVIPTETEGYWSVLRRLLERSKAVGPTIHDARVASLCLHHGVRELWTADRDFSRFPDLDSRNPLVA